MTLLIFVFSFVLAGGILPAVVLRRKGILWVDCRQYDGLISNAFSLLLCYGIRLHVINRKITTRGYYCTIVRSHPQTCLSITDGNIMYVVVVFRRGSTNLMK